MLYLTGMNILCLFYTPGFPPSLSLAISLRIHLLAELGHFSCGVSCSLTFADCVCKVQFTMILRSLYLM